MPNSQQSLCSRAAQNGLTIFAGILLTHLCLQWLGNQFYFDPEGVATLWPASGLLVAAFILADYRRWLPIIAAALVSGVIANLIFLERELPVFLFFAGAELVECMFGAWLLRRAIGRHFDILNFRHVLLLILAAGFAATTFGALLGAMGVMIAFEDVSYWVVWRVWWFADVLGVIVVSPLLLAIANAVQWQSCPLRYRQVPELVLLGALMLFVWHFIFGTEPAATHLMLGLPYLAFPLVIWAAIRFRPVISAAVTLLLVFGAVWQADRGLGPFINPSLDIHGQALSVQGFIAALSVLSPLLSATVLTAIANESLFKSFLDNTPNLLTIKDLKGRYTHVSREFCRVFEVNEQDVIGRHPRDVLPVELASQVEAADRASIDDTAARNYEVTVATPQGKRTYMRVRFPVANIEGSPDAIGGIATDITDIRAQQISLQASEERHRVMLEAAGSGGWDLDVETGIIVVSDSFLELMGYRRGEVETTSRLVEENVHPDDLPRMHDAFVKHVKGISKFYECELRIRHKSGAYIWFLMRGSAVERNVDGRVVRIVGANFNIDDRKRAEEALIESEMRYRYLFEAAPVALFESDWTKGLALIQQLRREGVDDIELHLKTHPSLVRKRSDMGVLIDVNQEALRIYGADSKSELIEWIQESSLEAIPAGLIERMAQHAAGQRRNTRESTSTRIGGESFDALVTSEIISDDPADWSRMLTSELDISALKSTESQLRESEARFRNLAEGSLQGIAVFDAEWELAFVNKALAELLGYDDVQSLLAVGNWARFIPEHEMARISAYRDQCLRGEAAPNQYETDILKASGGVVNALVGVRLIDWNQAVAFQYIVFDLTEKKRAERAVQLSEERYRHLFETAPVSLWEQDWSGIKILVDGLKRKGVENVCAHLRENPELLGRRAEFSKVIDVNAETLRLYDADDKQSFLNRVRQMTWQEWPSGLLERIEGFLDGRRRVVVDSEGVKVNGNRFPIRITTEIVSESLDNWSRIYTSEQDITEELQAEARLMAYQSELRELAGKISLAEEDERRRIASELHDGTVQNLVLARMNLSTLQKSLDDEREISVADGINELLEQSLKETRSMIFELSPPVLYELGLAAAIEWLCDQFKQRTGISITFSREGVDAPDSQELNVVMFQAVRECLVNISKHARASNVAVEWQSSPAHLVITVEDDGTGFDVNKLGELRASEGGFGLFSIRERLGLLGAGMAVNSSSSGTKIELSALLNN